MKQAQLHIMAGDLMVLVGIGAVLLARTRWHIQWRWLGCGVLLWLLPVFEKWGIDALLHQPVLGGLEVHASRFAFLTLGSIYIGLLTGITEVVATLVAGLIWRQLAADAWRAVGIGLGAGAFEAMFFGVEEMFSTATIEPEHVVTLMFAPAVERVMVIICHIVVRAMVLFAVATRRWRWFWAAFAFFGALDGLCGYYILAKLWPGYVWRIELSYLGFAAGGLVILRQLLRCWPSSHSK